MNKLLHTLCLLLISMTMYSQENYPNVYIGKKLPENEKHERYQMLQKGDKYGFVNEAKKFSIKPKFDNASDAIPYMSSFLYPVCYQGKWGLLNQDGSYNIYPILDDVPVGIGPAQVLCNKEGKTFVLNSNEMLDYKELPYHDRILYIPDDTTQMLYIEFSDTRFYQTCQTWHKIDRGAYGIYQIKTNIGSFFFNINDHTPAFSDFGPADSFKFDYLPELGVHAIWTDDEISLWTGPNDLVVSGCNAVQEGAGYVVGLNLKRNKLFIYDGNTSVVNLECPNPPVGYVAQTEFLKSLNETLISPPINRSIKDYLTNDAITSVKIYASDIRYLVTTNRKGQSAFWLPGPKLGGVFRSSASYKVVDAEKGHIIVIDGDKYGFINTKTRLWIRAGLSDENDLPLSDKFRRYSDPPFSDFIANSEVRYTIKEYEQYLYDIFQKNMTIENCKRYIYDELLSYSESTRYDEVKRYMDLLQPKGRWTSKVETMEESVDGNIYTYDVVQSNGFVFRQRETSPSGKRYKPEVVIDDFAKPLYITVEDFTGYTNGNLSKLKLEWKKPVGNAVYALYDFEREAGQEYVGTATVFTDLIINPVTGVPVLNYGPEEIYETKWKSNYNLVKVTQNGIQSRMAFTDQYPIVNFKYDYITIINGLKDVLCVDYDFNHIYNFKSENAVIIDAIRYQGRWVLVGSTKEAGYVGYENYYVMVTDASGNVLATSHLPVKNGRLTKIVHTDSNVFEVTGTNIAERSGSVKKQISVDVDGTITWL